jgi:Tfp pilus assembly protein PilV
MATPPRRGLTMVEVLAATLLSALLMSAVLGVLKAVTGHQKAFTQGMQESWQPQLRALLEWDLSNSKTVLLTDDGFELRGFSGRDLVSGMPLHCRTSIQYEVKKVRDESCLVRTETHLDAPNLDSVRSGLVLSRVERIVLGEPGGSTPKTTNAADAVEGTPLPEQATVVLIASDSHAEVFRHVFPLH